MGAMFEKGQTKRYSRVSTGMSGGGEAKAKKRSKDDDKSEAAEANPYGSTKALDEATKNMRKGGMTKKYAVGGATRPATPRGPIAQALAARSQKIAQRQAQQNQVAANREAIAQRQAQRREQRAQVAMNRLRRGQSVSMGSNRNPLAGMTFSSPVATRKAGGTVKGYSGGGKVASKAASRADGCAARGKTKGKIV